MSTFFDDISDLDLQAFIDNALTPIERVSLIERLQKSPAAQDRLAELQSQKDSLKAWWKNQPPN